MNTELLTQLAAKWQGLLSLYAFVGILALLFTGGVIGGASEGGMAGVANIITVDIGGTCGGGDSSSAPTPTVPPGAVQIQASPGLKFDATSYSATSVGGTVVQDSDSVTINVIGGPSVSGTTASTASATSPTSCSTPATPFVAPPDRRRCPPASCPRS